MTFYRYNERHTRWIFDKENYANHYWLERYSFKTASKLNVVSAGFLGHVKQIVPDQSCSVFTNGIDQEFLNANYYKKPDSNELPLVTRIR